MRDSAVEFDTLKQPHPVKPALTPELRTPIRRPTRESFEFKTKEPGWLSRHLPGGQARLLDSQNGRRAELAQAHREWEHHEKARQAEIARLEGEAAQQAQAVAEHNAEVDRFRELYFSGDREAIATYNGMVLERSVYPEGFPQEFRIAFVPESRQLVVEYELPLAEVVPTVGEYRFVKSRDAVDESARKDSEVRELYSDVVASVALRTLREVFSADQANQLEVVVFNGFVQATDPATGQHIAPHLISVRVTKERFSELVLERVDKRTCLRNLGASVSPQPHAVQPVKPIVSFDMVDHRFVDSSDVLADLESRPNLYDLSPFEFENLVGNLFSRMGLETRQTQSSRDGGVDVVAFDARPVLGGKVIIQAKRYRHTVGVSAVRDLYGTMLNEGASKGILVTTSGYGRDAFEFAKDKPIELIEGGGLLYLLEQRAEIRATIVFPPDDESHGQ
jgi:restriction system protein